MKKIQLEVLGLSQSQAQSGAYALILVEKDGSRKIPIIIGGVEAQSIAIQLESLKPPRPLTHDLFKSFADALAVKVNEICIYRLKEGIFYSELVCEYRKNRIRIDARTSDAIALALRFNCPIYAMDEIVEKTGIELSFEKGILKEEEEEGDVEFSKIASKKPSHSEVSESKLKEYSTKQLKALLEQAIKGENYEWASKIRDEIKLRDK